MIIKHFLLTYFSLYPQRLYKRHSNYGNMDISGIGLGLINTQRIFWISNFIIGTTFYVTNDDNIHLFIFPFCAYLYSFSFCKTYNLLNLLLT
jgi:hypothetical protein